MLDAKDSYYLVALPEKEILKKALKLQEEFSQRYGIYEPPYPPIHLTLAIIQPASESELAQAISLLTSLLPQFLPFRLHVKGISCFSPPYKSLNLAVAPSEELLTITRTVITRLATCGINSHAMEGWDYHISLVNTVFAAREWTEEEFNEACAQLARENLALTCTVNNAELWSPTFPPLKVLARMTAQGRLTTKQNR
ncbi:MAG TPA: 2'-5' RNA ligase family protein [Firmicutes bacterium]|nr:2'-5' RNA ligase family protein [Bacillota bacterium]